MGLPITQTCAQTQNKCNENKTKKDTELFARTETILCFAPNPSFQTLEEKFEAHKK